MPAETFNPVWRPDCKPTETLQPERGGEGGGSFLLINELHHIIHRDGLCFIKIKPNDFFRQRRDKLIQEAAEADVNTRRVTSWTSRSNHMTDREPGGGGGAEEGEGFTLWKAAGWERAAAEELRSVWFRVNVLYPSLDKYRSNHWNVSH